MKIVFNNRHILLLKTAMVVVMMACATMAEAQIGVDQPDPNPFSILDLQATDKGLLIPRLSTSDRSALLVDCGANTNCPNGLLVFDSELKSFFFLNNSKWFSLNPWTLADSSLSAEEMESNELLLSRIGIGINPGNAYKLDVNGAVQIRDSVGIAKGVIIRTGNLKVVTGNISAPAGNISTTSGNISTSTGVVTASGFSTDITTTAVAGPVPIGGIIMWSGSIASIPAGWAICNGANGTPNLQDRFIVGAGSGYTVNNTGGNASTTLSTNEMPSHNHNGFTGAGGIHSHGYMDRTVDREDVNGSNFNNQGINGVPDNHRTTENSTDHTHSIPFQGNGAAFENRPPYYALAYIMKL
jgi:microcystin-dependent protein